MALRRILSLEELEAAEIVPAEARERNRVDEHFTLLPSISNKDLVLKPIDVGRRYCLRLERVITGFLIKFKLHLENTTTLTEHLIMTAERHLGKEMKYTIETINDRGQSLMLGHVKSNLLGTTFSVMEHIGGLDLEEVASIEYESRLTTQKITPRKLNIIIPSQTTPGVRFKPPPLEARLSLIERIKSGGNHQRNYVVLSNKKPQWSDVTQNYTLNFDGRVNQASVKNFQIVHPNDIDYITLQFGRVDENTFNLDARYPFSIFTAFGVALTAFDPKLTAE